MKNLDLDKKLLDCFNGEVDEPIRVEIDSWLKKDSANRDYANRLLNSHLNVRWTLRRKLIKHDEFSELYAIINRRRRLHYFRVAMVAVFVVGIGCLLWLFVPQNPSMKQLATCINGEKSRALLILSKGQEISLEAKNIELQESDGSCIQVNDKGQVVYESNTAAKQMVFNHLIVPRGGEFSLVLSDGTRVWMNADSELKYPVQFAADCREVYLRGEAFFDVVSDSIIPFVVCTDEDISVKAYGTKFLVNTYQKNIVETVLVDGKVGIKRKGENQEFFLQPSERGLYTLESGEMEINRVDTSLYTAWIYGNYIFRNETLESIMNKLSRWYDIDVFYVHEELKNIRLSGDMKRYVEIDDFLFFFEQITNAQFEMRGKTLTISY